MDDLIASVQLWKHILEVYEQMLIEAMSNEPDDEYYTQQLDELIDMLTRTSEGAMWNRYKATDHHKKIAVRLEVSMKFARYKKPSKKEVTK